MRNARGRMWERSEFYTRLVKLIPVPQPFWTRAQDWLRRFRRDRRNAPLEIMIVRRDLSRLYYDLLEIFAPGNCVGVIVDRRTQERRHLTVHPRSRDRRLGERRGPAPATWEWGEAVTFRKALRERK